MDLSTIDINVSDVTDIKIEFLDHKMKRPQVQKHQVYFYKKRRLFFLPKT